MRACPQCSQLIHNAATVCRFCKESVPGDFAVALGWKDFAGRFHQASKRGAVSPGNNPAGSGYWLRLNVERGTWNVERGPFSMGSIVKPVNP